MNLQTPKKQTSKKEKRVILPQIEIGVLQNTLIIKSHVRIEHNGMYYLALIQNKTPLKGKPSDKNAKVFHAIREFIMHSMLSISYAKVNTKVLYEDNSKVFIVDEDQTDELKRLQNIKTLTP